MNLWIIVVVVFFKKKTDSIAIIHTGIFNILPKGKLSSDSNLIFVKSFPYLVGLTSLVTSI